MPVTAKEMIRLLKANGFSIISQSGSHVKLKNLKTDRTVIIPVHSGDLKIGTEHAILKQAGLK